MTTYAVADKVPEGCDYLTAGKEYEFDGHFFSPQFFVVIDDRGATRFCKWGGCGHLNGGNWRRVEK